MASSEVNRPFSVGASRPSVTSEKEYDLHSGLPGEFLQGLAERLRLDAELVLKGSGGFSAYSHSGQP